MSREGIIKIVSSIIVFAILTLCQCSINAKRINRRKQLLMPVIALVYSLTGLFFVYRKFDLFMRIIRFLQKTPIFNRLSGALGADVLVINLILALVYVFGRIVPNVILILLSKNKALFKQTLEVFYTYDENYGEWLLKERWTGIRDLFRVLTICAAFITGSVCGFIWHKGFNSVFHAYVFPALAAIIIAEIFVFLNGITEIEFLKTVTGDDSYAQKVRAFYKIREIYEQIFAHEILTSETGCDFRAKKSVTDLIEELESSENETERKIAEFYKLNGSPEEYDADYILATMKLLKGENVLFFDPFYRDLDRYLILPLLYNLLSNDTVLIITGRESAKEDVADWIGSMISDYGKIESLWRVRQLDIHNPECEIGIIGASTLYDASIMTANDSFMQRVGLVIMIEPSHIVNTGQIGLSILGRNLSMDGETPVYCFMDRITDGLVDALSHILQTNITEVEAPPVTRNIHTAMAFDADGDYLREKLFEKQTGYLADGIELSAVAIKNQIPKISWYSDTKSPIRDIKWKAGQYFATICKYMNVPIQQESLYEHIDFISNIWSMPAENYQFIIVEDEFRNMFNTMRMFLSRGREQTFVNVLTENYLLKDYMRCNTQMFMSNPDAIPSIVPDYAKTERNVLIKLLYEMSIEEISETEIVREFSLVGIADDDALSILSSLLEKYLDCDNSIFRIRVEKRDVSEVTLDEENFYSILRETFDRRFRKNLKYACFICENEGVTERVDARLFGHITQTLLPGQYVVFNGKYYIVHDMSADNGVILRRASDLYDGRKYYRQMREYIVSEWSKEDIITSRTVMDIEFTKLSLNFEVKTYGYLEMNSNNDLRSARRVDLRSDPHIEDFNRSYHHKSAMLIRLPDTDTNIRFTVSMLLSELFKTVFPDAWEFIAVTTVMPEDVDGMLNYVTYDLSGAVEDDYIMIFEDSEMDLGLLEAVEKNMIRFLQIIADFLGWHFEKMREAAAADPEPVTPEFPAIDYKKRKKTTELFKRIRNLFGVKREDDIRIPTAEKAEVTPADKPAHEPKPEPETAPAGTASGQDNASGREPEREYAYSLDVGEDEATVTIETRETVHADGDDGTAAESAQQFPNTTHSDPVTDSYDDDESASAELTAVDGTDIFDENGSPDDDEYLEECFIDMGIVSPEKSRYQRECFLKFGFDNIDARLRIEDVHKYLTVRGFADNAYRKARTRDLFDDTLIDLEAVNHCDFCGFPISGVSYERLTDGRIRCNDCSMTAIRSVDEFRKVFNQTLSLMQSFFDIDYRVAMNVRVVDAEKIAKGYGSVYRPSTEYTERVLAYAKRSHNGFEINVENGSPRLAAISSIAHELTHIWQFRNWNEKQIERLYPAPDRRDMVYEGMAVWTEIQYLYLIGENSYALKQEIMQSMRQDVYGYGFNMYREKYPLIKDSSLIRYSPFTQFPPL